MFINPEFIKEVDKRLKWFRENESMLVRNFYKFKPNKWRFK
jgi:hypothetical protein